MEEEAQARKTSPILFLKKLLHSASKRYTCPRPGAYSSDP